MLKGLSSSSSFLGCLQRFHELFTAFQYDIIDRVPDLLCFVYMSCINHFCQCLFYFFKFGIAKTDNEMTSNVLWNILGWPGLPG